MEHIKHSETSTFLQGIVTESFYPDNIMLTRSWEGMKITPQSIAALTDDELLNFCVFRKTGESKIRSISSGLTYPCQDGDVLQVFLHFHRDYFYAAEEYCSAIMCHVLKHLQLVQDKRDASRNLVLILGSPVSYDKDEIGKFFSGELGIQQRVSGYGASDLILGSLSIKNTATIASKLIPTSKL